MRSRLAYIFRIIFINLVVIGLVGEVLCRCLPQFFGKHPPYDTAQFDDQLGWKPKPNYTFDGMMQNLDGSTYPVHLSTQENGFRHISNKQIVSGKTLFLIGDSFTQAVEVSDDKTFYALLADSLSVQIDAFGMAGYGSLQEYMVIDQYIDEIQPDIVLLQFCSNDFIDNSLLLEKEANYHVGLRRPYLDEDDQIYYESPLHPFNQLINHSAFIRFLGDKWRRLKGRLQWKSEDSAEAKIAQQGLVYPAYQQAVARTAAILQKIKLRVGDERAFFIFLADPYEPQRSHLRQICERLAIPFIDFPTTLFDQGYTKESYFAHDGYHWNEAGHRLIFEHLTAYLKKQELFQ